MAAPIAKGIIITASVLFAAGIAFYENEHIREWIQNSRRKLALALHSLGDEINPPSHSRSNSQDDDIDPEAAADFRRRRREEIIRLNRLELVKRAREEGIAVDLDELAAIGRQVEEGFHDEEVSRSEHGAGARSTSFDHLVGSDGMLKSVEMAETTAISSGSQILRHRGAGARGLDTGALYANPFADEMEILYDHDEQPSRESSKTISPAPLVDVSDAQSEYFSEEELEAQIDEAIRRSLENVSETPEVASDPPTSVPAPPTPQDSSFYYAPPPNVHQPPLSQNSLYASAIQTMLNESLYADPNDAGDEGAADGHHTPAGTLTPTEDGFSTIASMASGGDDIGVMSDLHSVADSEHEDNHDDAMSENGYQTSEFSMVGASTPGSWTDVESEASEEEGHQLHYAPVVQTHSHASGSAA